MWRRGASLPECGEEARRCRDVCRRMLEGVVAPPLPAPSPLLVSLAPFSRLWTPAPRGGANEDEKRTNRMIARLVFFLWKRSLRPREEKRGVAAILPKAGPRGAAPPPEGSFEGHRVVLTAHLFGVRRPWRTCTRGAGGEGSTRCRPRETHYVPHLRGHGPLVVARRAEEPCRVPHGGAPAERARRW